jgi:hypothetical protein
MSAATFADRPVNAARASCSLAGWKPTLRFHSLVVGAAGVVFCPIFRVKFLLVNGMISVVRHERNHPLLVRSNGFSR